MAGYYQKLKKNVSGIYNDPFQWGVVKSVGVFLFGIYLARDLKGITIDTVGAGSVASQPML